MGLEPATPTSERQQTHTLDLAATGMGRSTYIEDNMMSFAIKVQEVSAVT